MPYLVSCYLHLKNASKINSIGKDHKSRLLKVRKYGNKRT